MILQIKSKIKIIINLNKREPTFWGPLQVWPMVYILYIGINLAIIMKQYGANASNNPYLIIENRNSNNLIIYPIYNIYPLF